jgi:hypothetical protein
MQWWSGIPTHRERKDQLMPMLTEEHKNRLAAHWRRVSEEYPTIRDPAYPGTRLYSPDEAAAGLWDGLNEEEVEYVQSLCLQAAEHAAEQLAAVETRVGDLDPADDPVIKRIDDLGTAD